MQITSISFLLLFLPLIFLLFRAFSKKRIKILLLLAASAVFYWFGDAGNIFLLFGLSWLTFFLAKREQIEIAVAVNLLFLLFFKYSSHIFSIGAVYTLLQPGIREGILSIGLPMGASYVVFKHIGYLLDIKNKRITASNDILTFGTFSSYFPQIVAGPISSFTDMDSQIKELSGKILESRTFKGLIRLSLGFAKVTLISNVLADWLATSQTNMAAVSGFLPSWIVLLALSMRLYFDFSGYSDMAIGLSYLFGIKLPENFNNPYISRNYRDFWERWHISLSLWFRLYFFSPLSRRLLSGAGRNNREIVQIAATIITMALIGFWHGIGWNFILWGLYHGVLMSVNIRGRAELPGRLSFLTRPVFLVTVVLGWAIFFSQDLGTLKHFMMQLFGLAGFGTISSLEEFVTFIPGRELAALFISLWISLKGYGEPELDRVANPKQRLSLAAMAAVLFLVSIAMLDTNIEFLYGQF